MVTDFNRRLLVTQDWFYSELYRELLREFHDKQAAQSTEDDKKKEVEKSLEEIALRWKIHDIKGNFKDMDEPLKDKPEAGTQTLDNPQGDMDEEEKVEEIIAMTEPEIVYNISLFKKKMQRTKDKKFLAELHKRALHTAKVLTKQAVESQTPVCLTLSKHENITKENV